MLEDVGRNDGEAWASLARLEMRMLLARGQTYQARQFAERLPVAAEAGLEVESYERREIQQLINAIDSVQARRHFLALHQLEQAAETSKPTIQWAAHMWRSRSLAAENDLARASEATERSLALAEELEPDARLWSTCFAAELQAKTGETAEAESRILHVVSSFVGQGEVRGVSFAYLAMAFVNHFAGAREESEAAAELAYNKDGSWTGPVIWLARLALENNSVEEAEQLLRSIPNPTTDAYSLIQALALVEARKIPLEAVLSDLALADRPSSDKVVDELRTLTGTCPRCNPARETLAWKLLYLGRSDEAAEQLRAMVLGSADSQSIAAVRFGLQTYDEIHAAEDWEPTEEADFVVDEATPIGLAVETEAERQKRPTAEVESLMTPEAEVERQKKPTDEVERRKKPTAEVERRKKPTAEVERRKRPTAEVEGPIFDHVLARGSKRSGFAGQISLFGVPDLIQFFCGSRKTGMIEMSSQRGEARIRLYDGSIYWAVSPAYPSVTRFLREKEVVPQEQMQSLDDHQFDEVNLLAEQDGVDLESIREALRQQIHLTVRDLIDWLDGWFMFDAIRDGVEPRQELLFNAQGILLDVMREMDEENR